MMTYVKWGAIPKYFLKGLMGSVSKQKLNKMMGVGPKSINNFIDKWQKLTPNERDKIRLRFNKKYRDLGKIRGLMHQGLIKKELNRALSTNENNVIDMYQYFIMYEEKVERKPIDSKSGWLIWAEYHPKTKTCFIKMRDGRLVYPFFGVPKSKWLALCELGGDFMWDKFGRLYSARPQNWVRGQNG